MLHAAIGSPEGRWRRPLTDPGATEGPAGVGEEPNRAERVAPLLPAQADHRRECPYSSNHHTVAPYSCPR